MDYYADIHIPPMKKKVKSSSNCCILFSSNYYRDYIVVFIRGRLSVSSVGPFHLLLVQNHMGFVVCMYTGLLFMRAIYFFHAFYLWSQIPNELVNVALCPNKHPIFNV